MKIISIVPRLYPAIDGVGDYALSLARQLRLAHNITTQFVVGDHQWTGEREIEEFPVYKLSKRSINVLKELLNTIGTNTILLNYVGYGYAKRGCPFWLINGLKSWRSKSSAHRIVTMFHEISASGPLWTSAFWLASWQKTIARQLLLVSDHCTTSSTVALRQLTALNVEQAHKVSLCPIFSSMDEPDLLCDLSDRPRRLVIFGTPGIRRRVYQQSLTAIKQTCNDLGIEEVYDIGASTGQNIAALTGIKTIELGIRSSAEISSVLSGAVAGLFDYTTELLPKSSIFAAYCAHKLTPIVTTSSQPKSVDGLEINKHYWIPGFSAEPLTMTKAQAIADKAFAWYQCHNLAQQALTYANLLRSS